MAREILAPLYISEKSIYQFLWHHNKQWDPEEKLHDFNSKWAVNRYYYTFRMTANVHDCIQRMAVPALADITPYWNASVRVPGWQVKMTDPEECETVCEQNGSLSPSSRALLRTRIARLVLKQRARVRTVRDFYEKELGEEGLDVRPSLSESLDTLEDVTREHLDISEETLAECPEVADVITRRASRFLGVSSMVLMQLFVTLLARIHEPVPPRVRFHSPPGLYQMHFDYHRGHVTAALLSQLMHRGPVDRIRGVELGTSSGITAEFLLMANPYLELIAVDPNPYPQAEERLTYFKNRSALWKMTSEAASRKAQGTFDLVFIDALHDYESVAEDITLWAPLVSPCGGILGGHDYQPFNNSGVITAVHEFIDRHPASLTLHLGYDFVWWIWLPPSPSCKSEPWSWTAGTQHCCMILCCYPI